MFEKGKLPREARVEISNYRSKTEREDAQEEPIENPKINNNRITMTTTIIITIIIKEKIDKIVKSKREMKNIKAITMKKEIKTMNNKDIMNRDLKDNK